MRRMFAVVVCLALGGMTLANQPVWLPAATEPPARTLAARDLLAEAVLPHDGHTILLKRGSFDPLARTVPAPSADVRAASPGFQGSAYWLVQFTTDLSAATRRDLEAHGVRFVDYVPAHAYVVRATDEGLARLRATPTHRWSGTYQAAYKADPILDGEEWGIGVFVNVRVFPGENPLAVLARLQAKDADIAFANVLGSAAQGQSLRVFAPAGHLRATVDAAVAEPGVWHVEPWFVPGIRNDNSVWVVQSYDTTNRTSYTLSATFWNHGITGTGQTPAVCDSGNSHEMNFFRLSADPSAVTDAQSLALPDTGTLTPDKKIVAYYVLPGAAAYDDNAQCTPTSSATSFHGTHTTGSVLGDNYVTPSTRTSGGHNAGDGMAPNARLIFQDAGDAGGCLAGTANDLEMIFEQAYRAGARIHSNSWGGSVAGQYTYDAYSVDHFVWAHEDFLPFFSAGNSGSGAKTIGSPGTAKNCATIGATTNGSAGANSIASFSSRGPCVDGRRKPDIVAPGYNISSASGFGPPANLAATQQMSGTSMACPTAAGAATLLRQYFTDGFYPTGAAQGTDAVAPSAALLKAALVNGAVDVSQANRTAALSTLNPDNNQGYGRVLLDTVGFFSTPSRSARRLRTWDPHHDRGLRSGETNEYRVQVAAGQPLKVTLAWSDPPCSPISAANLVNNLDLEVVAPNGVPYYGNVFAGGQSIAGGAPDTINNVEEVFIVAPAAGTWVLRVHGTSVPGFPGLEGSERQGYGLVATYADCVTDLAAPQAPAAASTEQGIRVTWSAVAGATQYQVYRADGDCSAAAAGYVFIGTATGTEFVDTAVQGGYTYSYSVRAADDCAEGPASTCASVRHSGNCTVSPQFAGITGAVASIGTTCGIDLQWQPATSACPLSPGITYNVYRGTSPYFTPDAVHKAGSTTGLTFTDATADPLTTAYYIVRAEDGTTLNGGTAHGGNEDTNLVIRAATPAGTAAGSAPWVDRADTATWLTLDTPWAVTNQADHTSGSGLAYHSAQDGYLYPPGTCAAATTRAIPLVAGTAPILTYWARYNFEYQWDGAVVEISADGGPWTVLTPDGGYPGTFAQTGATPINACGYAATQGAFTGPVGNVRMTEWTPYRHDLSAYAGKTVRLRWRMSSDPGSEFEGLYLDDIQVTNALAPASCQMSDGQLRMDRATYSCAGDTIRLSLTDTDIAGSTEQAVSVVSTTETAPKTVQLARISPTGVFAGSIRTSVLSPGLSTGLAVHHGDTVRATYVDASNGLGGTSVSKTVTALADCRAPVISNVAGAVQLDGTVVITWDTDEPADSRVTFGTTATPSESWVDANLTTAHSVQLRGLDSCSTYRFGVTSVDAVGNIASDDQRGAWYTFTSASRAYSMLPDDVETGMGTWQVRGNNGDSWHRSTCRSSSGTYAWKAGPVDCGREYDPLVGTTLTSAPIDLGPTGGFDLVFDEWLDVWGSDDSVTLGISTDGGATWQTLATYVGYATGWQHRKITALRTYTGTVRIRFELAVGVAPRGLGWYLDNIEISHDAICAAEVHYGGQSVIDACSAAGAGDHDGNVDPGEGVQLVLTGRNIGAKPSGPVTATLTSNTTGITVKTGSTTLPGIPVGSTATGAGPHLSFQVASNVACGTSASFAATFNADGHSWTDNFTVPIGKQVADQSSTLVEEHFATAVIPTGWLAATSTLNPWKASSTYSCGSSSVGVAADSKKSDAWLFTPALSLTAGRTYVLTYNYRTGTSASDMYEVKIGTKAAAANMSVTLLSTATVSGTTCTSKSITIPALATGTYYIGFHANNQVTATRGGIFIDDVKVVDSRPAHCDIKACTGGCAANPDDVDVRPDDPVAVCGSGSTTLTATPIHGTPAFKYQWLNGGTAITGATSPSYTATQSGMYTCQVTGGACTSPRTSVPGTQVTVGNAPAFAGISSVTGAGLGACGITLTWPAATPSCAGPVAYNVYRSTTSPVTTTPANRVATNFRGTRYVDTSALTPGTRYYYVVHAVDTGLSAEDANTVTLSAIPAGPLQAHVVSSAAFESGAAGWSHAVVSGTADTWTVDATAAHGGSSAFHAPEAGSAGSSALVSPAFTLATGGELVFWQQYDFESGSTASLGADDAGVLEINCGGAGWQDLDLAIAAPFAYNGVVASTGNNPLGGQHAWSANSGSWQEVHADLSAFAGQTCQVRFRAGFNATQKSRGGWWIDDVTITDQVAGACTLAAAVGSPGEASPVGSQAFLTSRTDDGRMKVDYTGACGSTQHAVYWGHTPFATKPNWTGAACGLGTSGTLTFEPGTPAPGTAIYFVVVGQNENVEGSYGKDSQGHERAEADANLSCHKPQQLTGTCTP